MARKNKEPDKLALDAAAALAAGMSYGQWKAMQEPVVIEKKIDYTGWIRCKHCGELFLPKRKQQLYCQAACQHYHGQKMLRQRRREQNGKAKNGLDEQTVHTEQ